MEERYEKSISPFLIKNLWKRILIQKYFENFDMEYNVECGAGIHFLRTEEEAKRYTNLI